ncbi:MAG: tRNA (guanosine(37)-N1)-methyltransferase TrmD [Gemmatimonadetes bacterium]|nr:tRNA (guanosine(37)-N1)-methyltransferase TrmD [Gemmatimonadota bacterium]
MKIDIVTLFPDFFASPLATSMMARAVAQGLLTVETHDPRDCATDKHRTVDDAPYGGGGGMVLKPEPVYQLWQERDLAASRCIYLTADGQPLNQALAVELALEERLVLLCGHYKGVDERIRTELIDREISIGDYVLTGGEPAALVLIDAVVRLIPNVLGNFSSALDDSFQEAALDCPWYTRPVEFRGQRVPDALLSGDHERIEHWRRRQALRRTFARRPDLLQQIELDEEEQQLIATWREQGLEEAP